MIPNPRALKVLVYLFCIVLAGCDDIAIAAHLDNTMAIRALIGEAGGQGDDELLAHAYALKNRGTLKGVYGIRSKWAKHPDKKTWLRAKNAWGIVQLDLSDPLDGRTEWRSKYDLKKMALKGISVDAAGLCDPVQVGDTFFFRRKK